MIRQKFTLPRLPNEKELDFINRMEKTSDIYGLSEKLLNHFIKVSPRWLRTFKERYNSLKYIGIVPQGRIHNVNGLYKMIKPNSRYKAYYRLKARFNMLCGILDDYYSGLTLGDIQAKGQISFEDQLYNEEDLIKLANEYATLLEETNE